MHSSILRFRDYMSFIKKYRNSLLWAFLICLLCFAPTSGVSRMPFPHFDKLVHFGLWAAFATLVISESNALRRHGDVTRVALRHGLIVGAALGLLVELIQGTTWIGRSSSALDWLADLAGVLAAIACYRWLNRMLRGMV